MPKNVCQRMLHLLFLPTLASVWGASGVTEGATTATVATGGREPAVIVLDTRVGIGWESAGVAAEGLMTGASKEESHCKMNGWVVETMKVNCTMNDCGETTLSKAVNNSACASSCSDVNTTSELLKSRKERQASNENEQSA